jgi:hypothetical protein
MNARKRDPSARAVDGDDPCTMRGRQDGAQLSGIDAPIRLSHGQELVRFHDRGVHNILDLRLPDSIGVEDVKGWRV